MDVLTDVMETIHLKSHIRGRLELTAPWGLCLDRGPAGFYVVTRGTCVLQADGIKGSFSLAAGDLVVLPKGPSHTLKDSPGTRALPIEQVLGSCSAVKTGCQPGGIRHAGGGGAPTTLVSGSFDFVEGNHNPLACALPPVIHVKGDGGTNVQWLEASLQFMASEMASGHPGAETVVSRLADILFVQAVRAHLAQTGEARGWLKALVDPQIGAALGLIHQRYGEPWTVDKIASEVGLSRSAFAARFVELVGEPPLTYLTRWRMQRAARLLRAGQASLTEIAMDVGYEADAAFNKAFKRLQGMTPGAYRRRAGAPSGRDVGAARS